MKVFQRYQYKKILSAAMWLIIGCGSIVLLIAAIEKKDLRRCRGLDINITGVSNNFFIDKKDIEGIIASYAGKNITGIPIHEFALISMEAELKREVWIKNAELYFDNNDVLKAVVEEREPVARIFTKEGYSFYIDDVNMMLPLSEKLSARLPVFTGFPSAGSFLSKKDSSMLNNIKKMGMHIQHDVFLMAMIEQVDITPEGNFEMIPKIGNQVIVFGDASDVEEKFRKLQLFYKKVMTKYGWSRYSMISLQYKDQVVAKLKGVDDVSADSMRTVQIMHAIAENTARQASDSVQTIMQDNDRNTTDVSIIQQSIERDEIEPPYTFEAYTPATDLTVPIVEKPHTAVSKNVKKPVIKNKKPNVKAIQIKKEPANPIIKPKAVMPGNEY